MIGTGRPFGRRWSAIYVGIPDRVAWPRRLRRKHRPASSPCSSGARSAARTQAYQLIDLSHDSLIYRALTATGKPLDEVVLRKTLP